MTGEVTDQQHDGGPPEAGTISIVSEGFGAGSCCHLRLVESSEERECDGASDLGVTPCCAVDVGDSDGLVGESECGRVVAELPCAAARVNERGSAQDVGVSPGKGKRSVAPGPRFGPDVDVRVVAKGSNDAEGEIRIVERDGGGEGGAEVGTGSIEPVGRRDLVGSFQTRGELRAEVGVVGGVSSGEIGRLAPGRQLVGRVLAEWFQEVKRSATVRIGNDHRLVDERSQHLEHVAVERRPGDHGLGRGEIEAPGEHRDSSEHDTFVVVEQFVAPVERRPHRSVPITSAVAPGGEHVEARSESTSELGQWHRPDAGGGELDRQRDAVHMAADLFDQRPVLGPERGTGVACSVDEQVDGVRFDG